MKSIPVINLIGGLFVLALAFGFIFRIPLALGIWPWEDGRYSYLFIGSILAAVSAAMVWSGWTGELGVLPAGSLNIFVISLGTTFYFVYQALQGRSELFIFSGLTVIMAFVSGGTFLRMHRLFKANPQPTPMPVRVSFGFFFVALILAGTALLLRQPIFPWELNPDSSFVFGCIFLGDAFYFLYGLLRPSWNNGFGQLLSFLAYDLVLIVPFVLLLDTVQPGHILSLIVYIIVLVYSSGLAVYYLLINPQTRFGVKSRSS